MQLRRVLLFVLVLIAALAATPVPPPGIYGTAINVLSDPRVDRSGATSSTAGLQALAAQACASSPATPLWFPSGRFRGASPVVVPAGCDGFTIAGVPGTYTLQVDPSNVATNASLFYSAGGQDDVRIIGATFDSTNNGTNTAGLMFLNAPMANFQCIDCTFRNAAKQTGIWARGEPPISVATPATTNPGQNTIVVASVPANLHAGAYIVQSNGMDPDLYIQSIVGTTLTMQKNLSDTFFATTLHFTRAFGLTADANYGSATLTVDSSSQMTVRETVHYPGVCLPGDARIKTINSPTSVTLDKAPTCKIPAGTNIANAAGFPRLSLVRPVFAELGQALIAGAPVNYTLAAATNIASVANQLTFRCVSSGCTGGIGLFPGNTSAATAQGGLPANDQVIDLAINAGAGTFTVTLQTALTADIASGTVLSWQGPAGSNGYGMWASYGAPWANKDWLIDHPRSMHTWSANFLISATENLRFVHPEGREDFMEYRSPTVAPSPCIYLVGNINPSIEDPACSGATGTGLENNHNTGLRITGGFSINNGVQGIYICGGSAYVGGGISLRNNGSYSIHPVANIPSTTAGLLINGSCTYGAPGTTYVTLSDIDASDDQAAPTQICGICQWHDNTIIAALGGGLTATGNIATGISAALGLPVTQSPNPDNRILNPCFAIDQANEGASVASTGYGPDMWKITAPAGSLSFTRFGTRLSGGTVACQDALLATVTTSLTPGTGDFRQVAQSIEAQYLYDLQWGTTGAMSLVLDVCLKASFSGSIGLALQQSGGAVPTYPINVPVVANTTSCSSIVIPGNQSQGITGVLTNPGLVLLVDVGNGLSHLSSLCNQWISSAAYGCTTDTQLVSQPPGATLYITQVRLYPASQDQPWLARAYDDELRRVQRYYDKTFLPGTAPAWSAGYGGALCDVARVAASYPSVRWQFHAPMRVAPTITTFNPITANDNNWHTKTGGVDLTVVPNPAGDLGPTAVSLGASGTIAAANDSACVQATADARF